jgi:hypothetical protein
MNNLLVAGFIIATILATPLIETNKDINTAQVIDLRSGRKEDTH